MTDQEQMVQITNTITSQVLKAMEKTITPIVLSAVQSCIPGIIQTVLKAVTETVESATTPLKHEINLVNKRVEDFR